MSEALISIKPDYVKKIFRGQKTAELRTRPLNLEVGTRLWIYSTLPQGEIVGATQVEALFSGSPVDIWMKFSRQICISKEEFDTYVKNREKVYVVIIGCPNTLSKTPSLDHLRLVLNGFHPPQFFKRLTKEAALTQYLVSLLTSKKHDKNCLLNE